VKPLDALKIAEELGDMYAIVDKKPDTSSPASIAAEISDRCAYLARSAVLMADTIRLIDIERGKFAATHAKTQPTIFKEMLSGHMADHTRLHVLAERLNATVTHQLNALRSMLSFEKELAGGHRT